MSCTHPYDVWIPLCGDRKAIFRSHPIRKSEYLKFYGEDADISKIDPYDLFDFDSRVVKYDGVDREVCLRTSRISGKKEIFIKNKIPCGQCMDCRIDKALEWTIRGIHEAELYSRNCFVTLTYDPIYVYNDLGLSKRHVQLFLKRLRKRYPTDNPRYILAGEYGEKFQRPHYHAIIFNFDFADKIKFFERKGFTYFTSESLRKLWPYGFHTITEVTPETIGYVCRYVLKKQVLGRNRQQIEEVYGTRQPEFFLMSRRPGIAYDWFKRYANTDVYAHDQDVYRKGLIHKPPKYFDKLFELDDPQRMHAIKIDRLSRASQRDETRVNRLRAREKITMQKLMRASERRFDTSGSF